MSNDFLASLVILGISALVLHFKSHLKFILLGLYVGIVLAETVALSLYNSLTPRLSALGRPAGFNTLQLVLLLLPTLILGFNHSVDKKKWGLTKIVSFVVVTTLVLLASIIRYLPDNFRQTIFDRSIIAFQLSQLYIPLLVIGAGLVIIESFYHKKSANIAKFTDKK